MAIIRNWRGRPRGLRELPAEVREAPRYAEGTWALDTAFFSVDAQWLKIRFESGRTDYWVRNPGTGEWGLTNDVPPWEKEMAGPLVTVLENEPALALAD